MDNKKRIGLQTIVTLLQNANFKGFFSGKLYSGPIKNVCVPGLNCYSCPSAVGSCPIGSLQNQLGAKQFRFPYYILGLLLFFGALFGRIICGFLCPFGFLQDLLYKIPFIKKLHALPGEKWLRKLKYGILLFLVIILPLCVKLTPFFCKYLCPSGTLSGIILALCDTKLFSLFGSQFVWKISILSLVILTSVVLFRPFCKYLCPLGAFYGLLNPISIIKIQSNTETCTGCGKCQRICDMGVNPIETPNSPECIRCGKCINTCPSGAIQFHSIFTKKNTP